MFDEDLINFLLDTIKDEKEKQLFKLLLKNDFDHEKTLQELVLSKLLGDE